MPESSWDKERIRRVAQSSGRPLEVECALGFVKDKWQVSLNSFYSDSATGMARELLLAGERRGSSQFLLSGLE